MSVPASEFQSTPVVGAPDSQTGVIPNGAAGMPTAQDSSVSPINGQGVTGVAPPVTAPPIDVAQIPEATRAYLEGHFRQGYVPSSDLDNLRSSLDQRVAASQNELALAQASADTARAQIQQASRTFNKYVQDVIAGTRQPHPNDAASFLLEVQQTGSDAALSRAQTAIWHREWEHRHENGLRSRIQEVALGGNGLPAIADSGVIANDPEVQRLDREVRQSVAEDVRYNFKRPEISQRVTDLTYQLDRRIQQVAELARLQAVAQPVVQEMAMVNGNLAKQEARGVQTQSLPGMTALGGAYDADAAWEASAAAIAAKYGITPQEAKHQKDEEVYAHWAPGYDQATRSRR